MIEVTHLCNTFSVIAMGFFVFLFFLLEFQFKTGLSGRGQRARNTNKLIHLSLHLICINLNMEHKQRGVSLLASSSRIESCYI